MFVLPYDTTICGIHKPAALTMACQRANIEFPFPSVTTPAGSILERAVFITPREEHKDCPAVTQFLNLGDEKNPTLVLDGRQYMRYDSRYDTYRLTVNNDYLFLCNRVALTLTLMTDGPRVFSRLGDLPGKVFVQWISLALTRAFGLSLEQQSAVMVLTAYYYLGLLDPQNIADEDERLNLVAQVTRITGLKSDMILPVADRIQTPARNAGEFAGWLRDLSGSLRFGEQFKFIDFYTVVANSWIGVSARENIGVALEHIPTWIALVHAALGERSYRRTILTQRAEAATRQNERQAFVSLVNGLISDQYKG